MQMAPAYQAWKSDGHIRQKRSRSPTEREPDSDKPATKRAHTDDARASTIDGTGESLAVDPLPIGDSGELRICSLSECQSQLRYGAKNSKKALFCDKHKLPEHVNVYRKYCQSDGCDKTPGFGRPGDQALFCKQHRRVDDVNVTKSTCRHPGCKKSRYFGPAGGSASFCSDHREPDHIALKVRRCQAHNCTTISCFGPQGGKTVHCAEHKQAEEIDLRNRRCSHPGCSTVPNYGAIGGGRPAHCASHRTEGEVDLRHPRCQFIGCHLTANYGSEGSTKPLSCAQHREHRHVLLTTQNCQHIGCSTVPVFGLAGTKKALFCSAHKRPEHVDIKNRSCNHEGCDVTPNFGPVGGRAIFCSQHRDPAHVNVTTKVCDALGCKGAASFGLVFSKHTRCSKHRTPGMVRNIRPTCLCGDREPCYTDKSDNYPLRCESCKIDTDLNVVQRECQTCGLMNLIREGLTDCSDCHNFQTKAPHKAKEAMVKAILDEAGLEYKSHDTIPDASCHRYRPDFLFDWGTHVMVVECDENQHKSYACECEQARMINLFQDQGGMKTVFIRFNPDSYRDRSGKLHQWTSARGNKLLDVIRQTRDHPPEHILSAVYLYYDGFDANAVEFVKLEYGL